MISLRSLFATVACVGALSWAQAAQVTVSSSGVFDGNVPNSFLSAPGAAWSMQFTMEAEPQPYQDPALTESGFFVTSPIAGFGYTLGGVAVAVQPTYISLYNAGNGGGIDVFFNDIFDNNQATTALSFYGPQIYSGDEFDPTLQPGVYDTFKPGDDSFWLYVEGDFFKHGRVQIVVAAVPVPATLSLALVALTALAAPVVSLSRRRPTRAGAAAQVPAA